ncbi:MAG TPA: ABC transporter ATP-binding protein [Conexibacter sp.]|jgi:ABC-2 type transport system ATP-binding protein|nr:ABC transporter ATP-binding protein [Conexibacter sp.]
MSEADGHPIEARGLVKRYGHVTAVDRVDLTVEAGCVYGYLGPNGAGKTTSLRMLLGLIRPDEGVARLFGRDPLEQGAAALDGVAGFVEAPRFYPYLSGRRNLELMAALDGGDAGDRIDGALETVDLTDRQGDKVKGYSHGMKQRLGIAAALLRAPRLLLLDEPTTGLDPAGMRDMRVLVRRLADEGMTVLLSSHLMGEVEELCDRVAIVRSGRVIYEGALDALLRSTGQRYRLRTTDDERALAVCRAQAGVTEALGAGEGITFAAEQERTVADLSVALVEAGAAITALVPAAASLEELFFRLTEGDGLVDAASGGNGVVPEKAIR